MEKEMKKIVVKSNVLMESRYKLTTREQKIILFLTSQIKKDDEEFKTYTLSVKGFSEMMGLKGKPKYTEIRNITDQLQKKLLKIKIEKKIYSVSWLSLVVYNEDEGTIDFRFDPFLKPFLLQLKKEFTAYQLQNIISLKGSYSIRLYELLKQYESLKERVFELTDLRELLGIGNMYPSYGNFKQRVLNPAKEEITDKTDIYFDFEEIKSGKSVKKVKFSIKSKVGSVSDFDNKNIIEHDVSLYERVNQLTIKHKYKVEIDTIKRWEELALRNWDNDFAEKLLALIDEVNLKSDVDNPVGYITSILKNSKKVNKEKYEPIYLLQEIKNLFKSTQELLPDYLTAAKIIDYLSNKYAYSHQEALEYFNENKEVIREYIKNQSQKNMKKRFRNKKSTF